MLQLKNLLMKRGALLSKKPRAGRKVFGLIGFADFASFRFFCLLPRYRFGPRNGFFMPAAAGDFPAAEPWAVAAVPALRPL